MMTTTWMPCWYGGILFLDAVWLDTLKQSFVKHFLSTGSVLGPHLGRGISSAFVVFTVQWPVWGPKPFLWLVRWVFPMKLPFSRCTLWEYQLLDLLFCTCVAEDPTCTWRPRCKNLGHGTSHLCSSLFSSCLYGHMTWSWPFQPLTLVLLDTCSSAVDFLYEPLENKQFWSF